MQMTTISLQVYYEHTTHLSDSMRFFILGLISLFEIIPYIITSFYSGHAADTYDRRKIILTGIFALFIGSVFLYSFCLDSFSFLKQFGYYPLFVVVIMFGFVRAFLGAAMPSFMSQLIPRAQYTNSAVWNSLVWHTGSILGPVIAAFIYGYNNALDAKTTYFVNCVLLLISLVAIFRISSKPLTEKIKEESVWESLKIGIRFVFTNKMLLSALSLDLFAVLFGGAVSMLVAFNDKILHASPEAFGWLRTAPAIGAVFMALIMVAKPPSKKAGIALLWSVIAFGVFTIAFAFSTTFWMAFMMLFLTGAFDNISVVVRHSILQLMTPENMRGRVSAVNGIFIGSSNEIGGFESGVAASLLGLVRSIAFGGCMTILVVLGVNKLNPKLKKLDLTEY